MEKIKVIYSDYVDIEAMFSDEELLRGIYTRISNTVEEWLINDDGYECMHKIVREKNNDDFIRWTWIGLDYDENENRYDESEDENYSFIHDSDGWSFASEDDLLRYYYDVILDMDEDNATNPIYDVYRKILGIDCEAIDDLEEYSQAETMDYNRYDDIDYNYVFGNGPRNYDDILT